MIKILQFFDYKLAFMRNMEEINSLLHDFKPKVEVCQGPFSVHTPEGVVVTNIPYGEATQLEDISIDDVEFEEDFEESIEIDPDLDEARRLNAGRT